MASISCPASNSPSPICSKAGIGIERGLDNPCGIKLLNSPPRHGGHGDRKKDETKDTRIDCLRKMGSIFSELGSLASISDALVVYLLEFPAPDFGLVGVFPCVI